MTTTPFTVANLHEQMARKTTVNIDDIELTQTQKLRAVAAGELFGQIRPHLNEEDEDNLGLIIGDLIGIVLYGNRYQPNANAMAKLEA